MGELVSFPRKGERVSSGDAAAIRALRTLPNVGPAIAGDLLRLGIRTPDELAPCDPDELYERLAHIDGVRHDPCLRDVFASVIAYVNGGPSLPWWHFTPERKATWAQRDQAQRVPKTPKGA